MIPISIAAREEEGYPTYQVGDTVQIVSTPYSKCPFSWIYEMNEWCGRTVTICSVEYSHSHKQYRYRIKEWTGIMWCVDCFEPIYECPEVDPSEFAARFAALLT